MPEDEIPEKEKAFSHAVEIREKRRLRAGKKKGETFWFGLGTFGLVGWSVALPMVGAVFLGIWIDSKYPGGYSWTLMLLVFGLVLGCFNAWTWISRQRKNIKQERENDAD